MTEQQIRRLIRASEALSGYFHADASLVIFEYPEGDNFAEYLDYVPVSAVREFEEALTDIVEGWS